MDESSTDTCSFDLGTWLGRLQALRLIASRCSVADIECLAEIYKKKLYRALGMSWERFLHRVRRHHPRLGRHAHPPPGRSRPRLFQVE